MRHFILTIVLLGASLTANSQVRFDADFESGNLGKVELLDSVKVIVTPGDTVEHLSYLIHGRFDPINPIDISLAANANWYYFRISGIRGKQIYLTLKDNGVHGLSYSYDGDDWMHFPLNESPRRRLDKRFDKDTVFIALYRPYTYSYLQERIAEWGGREGTLIDTIGRSFENRPLQLLHITDPNVPASAKKRLWFHGRQHPSETPGSWLLDAFIEKLTSDTPEARSLRAQIDAYILPFANPDGVFNGLSRSNVTGVNQEINFGRSDDSTVVEVQAMKAMFRKLHDEQPIDLVLNNHSQHADCAIYWMHTSSSTSIEYARKQWVFAGLSCSFNPYMYPKEMLFSDVAPRYCEGWFWNNAGERTIALTLETPYTFYSFNKEGEWVNDSNLRYFGERLLDAVAEYFGLSTPGRILIENPDNPKGWIPLSNQTTAFMGESGWSATSAKSKIIYRTDMVEAGEYELYRYIPGDNVEPPKGRNDFGDIDPGEHGWVFECDFTQKRDGRFKYVYKAKEIGDIADAILLIKKK